MPSNAPTAAYNTAKSSDSQAQSGSLHSPVLFLHTSRSSADLHRFTEVPAAANRAVSPREATSSEKKKKKCHRKKIKRSKTEAEPVADVKEDEFVPLECFAPALDTTTKRRYV